LRIVTVGRQLLLDWDRRDRSVQSLRDHLVQTDVLPADVDLLCAVAALDKSRQAESYCRKSKRELGLAAKLAPTTVLRALARLADRGLAVVDTAGGRIELLVDWHAVWSLARSVTPAERIARLRARVRDRGQVGGATGGPEEPPDQGGPGWSGVVRAPRTCLRQISRIRGSVDPQDPEPGDRDSCAGERTAADHSRPWAQRGGYSDEDLVASVASGDLAVVRHLWREAILLEWLVPSEDVVLAWLTCVHHCATVDGVRNRMGLLVHLVRNGLDTRRIRHEHEAWAEEVLRTARRDPQLVERVAVCD
jgi:hypothetical protein